MKYNSEHDKPFEKPEVGQNNITIIDAEEKESEKGNEMIVITVAVDEGQTGAGCEMRDYITDIPGKPEIACNKIGTILRACGKDPKEKGDGEFEVPTAKLIGLKAPVVVKHEEYKGKMYAKINYWVGPARNNPEDDIPF